MLHGIFAAWARLCKLTQQIMTNNLSTQDAGTDRHKWRQLELIYTMWLVHIRGMYTVSVGVFTVRSSLLLASLRKCLPLEQDETLT